MIGIIQARMTSTRFPGKVLEDIQGKPMLWHVVDLVRQAKSISEVVIATSASPADIPIVAFGRKHEVATFTGSEEDVLGRFFHAARECRAENVVRFCADSPLIDPDIVDKVVGYFIKGGFDYVNNWGTFPEGLHVEVCSFDALERAHREALKPSEREHVTPFFYNHPECFKIGYFDGETRLPEMRLVVDYPRDLVVVKEIFEQLSRAGAIHVNQIRLLAESNPQLFEINRDVPVHEGYHRSLRKDEQVARTQGTT